MFSNLRITTRHNAIWRNCTACGELSPLAPDVTRCPACRSSKPRNQRRSTRHAAR